MTDVSKDKSAAKAIAMVLLERAQLSDAQSVALTLSKRRPSSVDHVGDAMVALTVEGQPSMIGLVPTPIPWSQLAGPCRTAWWWPEAEAECRAAGAHLLVMTTDAGGDLFEANLRLTDIVSAISTANGVRAIYWGAGPLVHAPGPFRAEAARATRELLPLRLWIDFRIAQVSPGALSFATSGMKTFGLMEIECSGRQEDAERVMGRMFNVAHYLCDNGPVLKDGDTFGLSATEKVRVSHRPSVWKREGTVVALEFPSE